MTTKSKWLERLGFLSLFLTLITLAITITINFQPLYRWDVDYLNILDYTHLSKEELLNNYQLLIRFLNNPWNTTLALPDFPMSEAGTGHFYDVKNLFLLNYGILIVTMIPSGYFLAYLSKQHRVWRLIRPMQWGMIVPVFFGTLMFIGFDTFFVKFHELFFNNDDWLFNPATDPIINVLPEQFFMHCFILFFLLIEVFFFIFFWSGKRTLNK